MTNDSIMLARTDVSDRASLPYTHVVVHYGEIGLKKGNRAFFENTLAKNLRRRLKENVRRIYGRFVLDLTPRSDLPNIELVLSKTFGVANFAFAFCCRPDLDEITERALGLARQAEFGTFRIEAKRPNKRFPYLSTEVNRLVGAAVVSEFGKKVNLAAPDLTIHVEITTDGVYVYGNKLPGPCGLPVGVSGRALALISGGIDSPVAAIRAMKRGCRCFLVHFHNYTFYQDLVKNKILALAAKLSEYNHPTKLIIVPFLDTQREIVSKVPAEFRMLIYRRAMLRISERIARREKTAVFVTGDSLAQVASQTLENLTVIQAAAKRPILSPLIANDKNETLRLAREFGTYDISIRPYQDCCSAFLARHPATRARLAEIEDLEEDIDFEPLVRRAVEQAEVLVLRSDLDPAVEAPPDPKP